MNDDVEVKKKDGSGPADVTQEDVVSNEEDTPVKENEEIATDTPERSPSSEPLPEDQKNDKETENESKPMEDNFNDDEKALFEKLMKKIKDADSLDKELDTDLGDFTERVESIIDSVERIENIERSNLENLAYKDVDLPLKKEEVQPSPEEISAEELSDNREPDQHPKAEQDTETSIPEKVDHDVSMGQIYVAEESPYTAIKEGKVTLDHEGEQVHTYENEINRVLHKMIKLIRIKLDKKETEKAKELFLGAVSIDWKSEAFQDQFTELADILGIEGPVSQYSKEKEGPGPISASIEDEKETQVLDPELADEISILQNKAHTAINQLDSLIKKSNFSQDEFNQVKDDFLKATDLYREKMFHKSYEMALKGLEKIKNQVKSTIDDQIQSTLYKAKEMLEKIDSSRGDIDSDTYEMLKTTLDRAMKSYLTDEFERANLLSKRVINTILDHTEPQGGPLWDNLNELKKQLKELREMNIPAPEMKYLQDVLKSAENLLERRDITNAERILDTIDSSIKETRMKGENYILAKEMEIKINNRIERLKGGGLDLRTMVKKLGFLTNYLKDERYEDVLVVGREIENDLEVLEANKKSTETMEILEQLEVLIKRVDELEDPESYRENYLKIMKSSQEDDHNLVKNLGKKMIDEIKNKIKTASVDRSRNIATNIVRSKIMMIKLQSLNIDTSDIERKIRKSKNLLKEGDHQKGLNLLMETNKEMLARYNEKLVYLKNYINIYRDSLEVLMDRHKEEPIVYHIKRKGAPILRKMTDVGKYRQALENYKKIESKLDKIVMTEERKNIVGSDLNNIKFEIYKRKEEGLDISEPLSLYTLAQKRWSKGKVVPAEYLIEVSRRYCESFMPIA